MQIDMTPGEAQAIAELIDREVRVRGIHAAALYGNVLRQMIERAKEEADGNAGAE